MLVRKLRIYAMLMRLQELENERQSKMRERYYRSFMPEPMKLTREQLFPIVKELYDKNGKPFEQPKSKFHK